MGLPQDFKPGCLSFKKSDIGIVTQIKSKQLFLVHCTYTYNKKINM